MNHNRWRESLVAIVCMLTLSRFDFWLFKWFSDRQQNSSSTEFLRRRILFRSLFLCCGRSFMTGKYSFIFSTFAFAVACSSHLLTINFIESSEQFLYRKTKVAFNFFDAINFGSWHFRMQNKIFRTKNSIVFNAWRVDKRLRQCFRCVLTFMFPSEIECKELNGNNGCCCRREHELFVREMKRIVVDMSSNISAKCRRQVVQVEKLIHCHWMCSYVCVAAVNRSWRNESVERESNSFRTAKIRWWLCSRSYFVVNSSDVTMRDENMSQEFLNLSRYDREDDANARQSQCEMLSSKYHNIVRNWCKGTKSDSPSAFII